MKRIIGFMFLAVAALSLVACGESKTYYFASSTPTESSEWVSYVTIEKTGKKITDAHWSAFHIAGDLAGGSYLSDKKYDGRDKYTLSKEGVYVMTASELTSASDRKLRWDEQADLLVKKLIETQSVNEQKPVPAGASIATDDFYTLVEKALASDPIKKGKYVDGYQYFTTKDTKRERVIDRVWDPVAEALTPEGKYDYYTQGSFVIYNGTIVSAYYNSAFSAYVVSLGSDNKAVKHVITGEDGKEVSYSVLKTNKDKDGNPIYIGDGQSSQLKPTKQQLGFSYLMKKPNGQGNFEYFEAANAAAKHVLDNQGWIAELKEGKTDTVAGVTITASDFKTIADKLPLKK